MYRKKCEVFSYETLKISPKEREGESKNVKSFEDSSKIKGSQEM